MGLFRGKNAKGLTMIVAIAVVIVFAFILIVKSKDDEAANTEIEYESTELEIVMEKDLDVDYPASVREVVKFYCRILSCMFNEEVSDKQLLILLDQERALYDEELLKKNVYSEFVENQKAEIKAFKSAGSSIVNYEVEANEDVKYWFHDDRECASINVRINIVGSELGIKDQKFYLRRDENDKWKIVGFKNSDEMTDSETTYDADGTENTNTESNDKKDTDGADTNKESIEAPDTN